MTTRTTYIATIVKLVIAAVISVVLFMLVVSAMRSPVDGTTHRYTAEFSDVSGLGANGDIRTRGVRIGKVESIELRERDGKTIAEVQFTMEEPYEPTDTTTLAVKYQNLTGVRYIDADFGEQPGVPVEHVALDRTTPSFDITSLFNGLQPVLATMSTEDINQFTENAIALIQGDGGGLKPMLDDAQKLANLASDREQVISTLAENLSRISESMGGRSDGVVEFLRSVSFPIGKAMTVLDEFTETATYGPQFLTPIKRLLDAYGLAPGADVDEMVASAFASLEEAADAVRLLPPAVAGLQIPAASTGGGCSHGIAELPTDVQILLSGSEVLVCNAG